MPHREQWVANGPISGTDWRFLDDPQPELIAPDGRNKPVAPVYDRRGVTLYQADALTVLRSMPDSSVDAIVTDPPYGLADLPARKVSSALTAWLGGDREHIPDGPGGFMGRAWDRFVPPPAVWDECLRVLKPGGHMLVFAGSRTADLMGMSIRLAGFEIRDTITWLYSAGFPKSRNVSKDIDRMACAEREVIGAAVYGDGHVQRSSESIGYRGCDPASDTRIVTAPATEAARQWEGWGTALKPATEKVLVAHKPLSEVIFLARKPMDGTVAQTVLAHGTGALNIAACRIATTDNLNGGAYSTGGRAAPMAGDERTGAALGMYETGRRAVGDYDQPTGRWPPNTVLSHSPLVDPATGVVVGDACADGCVPGCAVAELDRQSGNCEGGRFPGKQLAGPGSNGTMGGGWSGKLGPQCDMGDRGGASRFFPRFRWQSFIWESKAPTKERPRINGKAHPTVKPRRLIWWLVRLVTPPGGLVADPFCGTGPVGWAARQEGMRAVLIDSDPACVGWVLARLDGWRPEDEPVVARGDGQLDLFSDCDP